MRLALLTTETTHHLYYARELAQHASLAGVVVETGALEPPFETFHPFEARRDAYEREVLLGGDSGGLADVAELHHAESVNDAAPFLRALAADVAVVFGTRRLESATIEAAAPVCLNLHGGNPEAYRGLDTHLWTIYHADWANLVTTLHHVDAGLDTGEIAVLRPVPLRPKMPLHELRAANTRLCVELTLEALGALRTADSVPRRPQRARGRYYSFMPAVLKQRCVEEFERYTATL